MTASLHTRGEEFLIRAVFSQDVTIPATLSAGLYNDSTDGLVETDDIGAITTEPDTGNYARLSYSFGTDFTAGENAAGNWGVTFAPKEYDLTNTTGTADAYFYTVTFQGNGDAEPTEHLIWSDTLSGSQGQDISPDLGTTGSLTLNASLAYD